MNSEHPGDDALSALLDGEATPEEVAHVEACATCTVRTGELRSAANLIGSPVPPPDETRRETAVAAALDARVVSLDQRRRPRQPPAWLLAAAVVVLALGLLPLLGRGSDDDDASSDRQETAADAPASGSADEDSAKDATAPFRVAGPVEAGDLGTVTGDELEAQVTAALRAPTPDASRQATTTAAGAESSPPACEPDIRAIDTDAGALRLTARATVDGRAARILAFEVPEPERVLLRVYVVAADDCSNILRSVSFPAP